MKTRKFFDWNIVTPQPNKIRKTLKNMSLSGPKYYGTHVEIRSGSCPKLSYLAF